MKNIIIAVLAAKIVSDLAVWTYIHATDKILLIVTFSYVFLCIICGAEEWLRVQRLKKWRAKKFARMIAEMKKQTLEAGEPHRSVNMNIACSDSTTGGKECQ